MFKENVRLRPAMNDSGKRRKLFIYLTNELADTKKN